MQTKQIAILFSGNGSNLEALIRALHNKYFCAKGDFVAQSGFCVGGITNNFVESKSDNAFKVEVVLALSNKKDAYGLTRARNLGIKTQVLESATYKDREEFDKNLVEILMPLKLDLCVLAGFMRILTPVFTDSIKAINVHPSLLPLFKGAHGIQESFASPMKLGGVSVHWVSEELDGGEIIAQGAIAKIAGESLESYEERIHKLEHSLYPLAVLQTLANQTTTKEKNE